MSGLVDIVVYTCVTHGYDQLRSPCSSRCDVEAVCFTDTPQFVPTGWDARPLQSPCRVTSGHDINRYHKMFPHRLFSDKKYSIYVDGNVWFDGSYQALVDRMLSEDAGLAAFSHPKGRNVIEESQACKRLYKVYGAEISRLNHQLRSYEEEGFDLTTGITANYLLVRNHNYPGLDIAMSLWWAHTFQFCKRDQLSLPYVLWRTGFPWNYLDGEGGVGNSRLVRYAHRKTIRKSVGILLRKVGKVLASRRKKGYELE